MQYHVPASLLNAPSSSGAATGDTSGARAAELIGQHSESVPAFPDQKSVTHSTAGVAVGHGLLSGRRLAVRVAPPTGQLASPQSAIGESSSPSISSHHIAHLYGGIPTLSVNGGAAPPIHTVNVVPAAMTVHHSCPASPAPPPQPPSSSVQYGGGIVRISDLRRQGVATVESGLRLPTLNSGARPAVASASAAAGASGSAAALSTRSARRRGAVGVGEAEMDDNTPFAEAYAPTGSRSTRGATRGRGVAGRGRGSRAGRGGRAGRSRSRGSTEVRLTENGELCEYRWFMARGRRCFVYDGRTYKGTTAHKMWKRVKEIADERQRREQRGGAAGVAAATPRVPGAAATATRPTRGQGSSQTLSLLPAAVSTRTRTTHRTSARAAAATQRSLHGGEGPRSQLFRPAAVVSGVSSVVRDEWRELARELSVELEDEEPTPPAPSIAQKREREQVAVPTAAQGRGGAAAGTPRPRREPLSSASQEVVEISDSSDSDADTADTSSSEGGDAWPRDASEHPNSSASGAGDGLNWPTTAYFSEESDGDSSWSSSWTPSETPQPAEEAPAQKRRRPESATAAEPRRVRLYKGVEVVEEDGWVYPAEVYASQRQQREPEKSRQAATSVETHAVLESVDDIPLASLYASFAAPLSEKPAAKPVRRDDLLLRNGTPGAGNAAPRGGIAVVLSGHTAPVPLKPSTIAGGGDALTSASVLREVGDDDVLDGFGASEVGDLFVTGEEVGGVRYGA